MLAALAIPLMLVPVQAEEGGGDGLLIDMGNGTTYWSDVSGGGTYSDMAESAAAVLGLEFVCDGSGIRTIGEMTEHAVGDQVCRWILYLWDGTAWVGSEDGDYAGGSFAWGFYPDPSILPSETPDNRTVWTMHRGDSSSSGRSDSYGTLTPQTPLEWYRTFTSGFVDSSIIVVGDYLYHTTGGAYGAPIADASPWVHCLNRFTGDVVWEFMMTKGAGYEVTSPVAIGDLLIVSATNGTVYCFDRFTGEVLHTLVLESNPPMDDTGEILWNGRSFFTGATTPVYDSGALYFGTDDGHVMSYTVTKEGGFRQLWNYNPDDSVTNGEYTGIKGCFYFHAPVITDIGGTRMLFIGSYEGYLYALNASTGEEMWTLNVAALGDYYDRNNPGSVSTITVLPDDRIAVVWADGEMDPKDEFLVCLDGMTGKGADGSDWNWKLAVRANGGIATEDAYYAYVFKASNGTSTLECADGTTMELVDAVYKFNLDGKVEWVSKGYNVVKAPLTMADGVIYTVDYSSGNDWPTGGGVTAISAEDGSELWRIKLTPFSNNSFNMAAITVIEGKVYAANDYGAVYCISDVAGTEYGEGGEIVLENGLYDWSWIVLFAVVILCLTALWKFY